MYIGKIRPTSPPPKKKKSGRAYDKISLFFYEEMLLHIGVM